jgi:hypothetical protein
MPSPYYAFYTNDCGRTFTRLFHLASADFEIVIQYDLNIPPWGGTVSKKSWAVSTAAYSCQCEIYGGCGNSLSYVSAGEITFGSTESFSTTSNLCGAAAMDFYIAGDGNSDLGYVAGKSARSY